MSVFSVLSVAIYLYLVPPAAGLAFGALREPGGSTGSFPRRRMTLIFTCPI
jgi:hypothetical protein